MSANKKDMRREDLIVPYVDVSGKEDSPSDFTGTMTSSLPMAAIFTRNKFLAWTAVLFAVQSWLAEPASAAPSGTPAIFSVGMALLSLGIGYMPLFLPPPPGSAGLGSGTEAPAAVPA